MLFTHYCVKTSDNVVWSIEETQEKAWKKAFKAIKNYVTLTKKYYKNSGKTPSYFELKYYGVVDNSDNDWMTAMSLLKTEMGAKIVMVTPNAAETLEKHDGQLQEVKGTLVYEMYCPDLTGKKDHVFVAVEDLRQQLCEE